jgi:hypothetical protein
MRFIVLACLAKEFSYIYWGPFLVIGGNLGKKKINSEK